MKAEKKRLGEMLLEVGVIDRMQLNSALGHQKIWGGKLGSILIKMGFLDEQSIVSVLEKQLGEKCVALENLEIPQRAMNAVKLEVARKYNIMPLDLDKNTLTIAVSDPTDVKTMDDLSFMLGVRIKPILALESEIEKAIARHYEGIIAPAKPLQTFTGETSETMEIIHNEPSINFEDRKLPDLKSNPVIEAIVSILIEKGIITRAELVRKLEEKNKKS